MSVGSFDRAAAFYDATRSLPTDIAARVNDLLADELTGAGVCLEIGVGTGRLALPLHTRGLQLVGIDIARSMLERLIMNAGGVLPFAVLEADATALPFASACFDAVVAGHVLHLIPNWSAALDEVWRVLTPGGRLLADVGGDGWSPWRRETAALLAQHGVVQRHLGITSADTIAQHLGIAPRKLAPVNVTVTRTLGQDLTDWENQIHSWTWRYSPDQIRAACAAIRHWANERGQDLDAPTELHHTIQWWAFDRPPRS